VGCLNKELTDQCAQHKANCQFGFAPSQGFTFTARLCWRPGFDRPHNFGSGDAQQALYSYSFFPFTSVVKNEVDARFIY